ncbi:MAG: SoxR reducing system RseC family protein [Deferribacteraceae bacterium]|jgi:positive regulator of sigma E activity|nr:SoxR reducing system RseC family protein [Deferribacteraceae bacterium]
MNCDIEGLVVDNGDPYIHVKTTPASACAGCAGKMLCGSGRILKVASKTPFSIGERVRLSVPHSTGFIISALLYGGGTLVGLIFALLAYYRWGDTAAAVAFLTTIALWFGLVLIKLRGYAKKHTVIAKSAGEQV